LNDYAINNSNDNAIRLKCRSGLLAATNLYIQYTEFNSMQNHEANWRYILNRSIMDKM